MTPRVPSRRPTQSGVALIEILVALLITAFGILGYVSLQARSTVGMIEGQQRMQALILINEIAERISLNRVNAAAYVGDDYGVTAPQADCSVAASRAERDVCEWSQLIRGAAEIEGGQQVGALLNARGCISNPATNEYVIHLVWQGVQASAAALNDCGRDEYTSEETRRSISTRVQIADLGA